MAEGPACYCAGTRLRLLGGETAVENLAIGDRLISADGIEVAVKWIGWRRVDVTAVPAPERVLPIRITKDALDDGVPRRDLFVSPDHGLYLDGILIPAFALCNGATITQHDVDEVTYYHVECERHTVLLAEGVPAESYLDTGNRSFFTNAPGAVALHPDLAAQAYRDGAVAPSASSGEAVEAVRRRLMARVETLGFVRTPESDLVLIADGRTIRPQTMTPEQAVFTVPAGAQILRLVSRSAVPAEIRAASTDKRRLGVAISRMMLSGHGQRHVIEADDPSLRDGFHDVERNGDLIWRWTNGAATLPYRPQPHAMTLDVQLSHWHEYWLQRSRWGLCQRSILSMRRARG